MLTGVLRSEDGRGLGNPLLAVANALLPTLRCAGSMAAPKPAGSNGATPANMSKPSSGANLMGIAAGPAPPATSNVFGDDDPFAAFGSISAAPPVPVAPPLAPLATGMPGNSSMGNLLGLDGFAGGS